MITSRDNEQIKKIVKLQQKKYRDEFQEFVIYGDHVISEAIKNKLEVTLFSSNPNKEGTLISSELMAKISPTQSPMDTLAIVKKPQNKPISSQILVLDDIQDPGNLGTLIRSAIGFGFDTIITSLNSADFYQDKVIRATQGTLFYANLIQTDLVVKLEALQKLGYKVYATALNHQALDIKNVTPKDKFVLVLGNEGSGVSEKILSLSDDLVYIKTKDIESLNVAMAGSIIMYEWQVK